MSDIERKKSNSKLEPHHALICEMREKGWSYSDIIKKLEDDNELVVGVTTLRFYCNRRGIVKNANFVTLPTKPESKSQPTKTASNEDLSIEELIGEDKPKPQSNPFTKLK